MTRQEKRRNERMTKKVETRLYSYDEMITILHNCERELLSEYNVRYSMFLATALSGPPFNFGKKRIADAIGLFFGQIEAIACGALTDKDVVDAAAKLGVTSDYKDGVFVVNVDPSTKNGKYKEFKNIYIGVKK